MQRLISFVNLKKKTEIRFFKNYFKIFDFQNFYFYFLNSKLHPQNYLLNLILKFILVNLIDINVYLPFNKTFLVIFLFRSFFGEKTLKPS